MSAAAVERNTEAAGRRLAMRPLDLMSAKRQSECCDLLIVEKRRQSGWTDRWIGGCYGPRAGFDEYVRQAGIRMGQLQAAEVVFLADGAHHNWEIQMDNFPGSVGILDFYHASEHLAAFCALLKSEPTRKPTYQGRSHLLDGLFDV